MSSDQMKTITVNIPDDLYKELSSCITVRKISGGMYGILDSFTLRLFALIEEGKTEHTFQWKKPT